MPFSIIHGKNLKLSLRLCAFIFSALFIFPHPPQYIPTLRCFFFSMKVNKRLTEEYRGCLHWSFHISKTQSNPNSSWWLGSITPVSVMTLFLACQKWAGIDHSLMLNGFLRKWIPKQRGRGEGKGDLSFNKNFFHSPPPPPSWWSTIKLKLYSLIRS